MNLVQVNNGQLVASSRDIAKHFEKAHGDVLKSVDNLVRENSLTKKMFFEASREYRGQSFRYFLMNRDGFSLLVMGFTGAKALDWKLKYIEAFNSMEAELKKNTLPADTAKAKRLTIMEQNAKVREAKLWEKLAQTTDNATYKQICTAYAANTLAGKQVLALPKAQQRTYTATEIAEMLGVTAHKIGRLANIHDMKIEEYGTWFCDKSRYSNKEVEVFRYYENAVPAFKALLKGGEAE